MRNFVSHQTPLYAEPGYNARRLKYLETGEMVKLERTIAPGDEFAQVRAGRFVGFVRQDWLEEYHDPFPAPALRLPQDGEILDAVYAGRAAQFLNLGWIGINRIHRNLCGEFCCAALAGMDVLPALEAWRKAYPRAQKVLADNEGMGIPDLAAMLDALGLQGNGYVRFDAKNPPSPARLAALNTPIIGVGINGTTGKLVFGDFNPVTGKRVNVVRHWVVLLAVLAAGSGGAAQIYNPFWNRVEIVAYGDLLEAGGGLTALEVLR